jgi:hypothetical protein
MVTVLLAVGSDGWVEPELEDWHEPGYTLQLHEFSLMPWASSETSSRRQAIYETDDWLVDGGAYLMWAGDLDGDGASDLLMETGSEPAVQRVHLYLSSAATKGEMVREVATLTRVGG